MNCKLLPGIIATSLLFLSMAQSAWSQEAWQISSAELQQRGFKPLFTGDSLERWKVEEGHRGHWVVRDGVIDYDGKASRTRTTTRASGPAKSSARCSSTPSGDSRAADAEAAADRALQRRLPARRPGKRITRLRPDAGDSGIMFRGILACQANIWCQELGSGEINGYRTNRKLSQSVRRSCIPLLNADRPMGQWNAFLITLQDSRMTVVLNGQQVLQSAPLPDLPPRGPIGLQHHGDPVQFRSIWVKEFDPAEAM